MTKQDTSKEPVRKWEINWPGVLFQLYSVSCIIYGFHFMRFASWSTILFSGLLIVLGCLGITAGSHRLWAHASYEATAVLRIFLMLCQTLTFAGSIYDWVLNHRIHHKYRGTDNDPFNYKRGWFYAHMGHTFLKKPNMSELAKEIDMSDIEEDKIVMFQKKFYWPIVLFFGVLLPINAPVEYWGESLLNAVMIIGLQRISVLLQASYLIYSAQCIWRLEPGDRYYSDSNWIYLISKSYWHDYHYYVPWDALTNEFGSYNCGFVTTIIKVWCAIGLASYIRTIDSWGIRRALEMHVETNKPIIECINEMESIVRERLPEDCYLLDRTNWPKK